MRTLADFAAACGGTLHGADAAFAAASLDSRKIARGDLFLALPGERADGHEFVAAAAAAGAAGAVVSRKLPIDVPQVVVDDVAAALNAGASAARAAFPGVLIGVAGSNGKTTVKEMLAEIMARGGESMATRGNLNNHLGVPLTLLRLRATQRSAVVEIGANHPGEVRALAALARPQVGLITNAGAEHLEGFGTLAGVARAEGEMVESLPASGTAVLNADDPFVSLWRGMTHARVLSFGFDDAAQVRALDLHCELDAQGFRSQFMLHSPQGAAPVRLALAGRHNVANALCAAAAALAAGASLAEIVAGLAAMRAVPGRLNFRLAASGAWLIDDSYNANPSSVRAAIDVLADSGAVRWLVLGDMGELGAAAEISHREIGAYAREHGVRRLFTHGALAALAAEEFGHGAECHSNIDTLLASLAPALRPEVRLLIKGSRVNRLERAVEALCASGSAAVDASGNAARKAG